MDIISLNFINDPEYIDININKLPPQIRNYIYIWCMKLFWRKYVPLTAQVPTWQKFAWARQKQLFRARQQNIHFMHLPFNTLPENKTYIIGCQCDYCKYDVDETYKQKEILKDKNSHTYFYKKMPYTNTIWNNMFEEFIIYDDNDDYEPEIKLGLPIFWPGYDRSYSLKDEINGPPIYFRKDNYYL